MIVHGSRFLLSHTVTWRYLIYMTSSAIFVITLKKETIHKLANKAALVDEAERLFKHHMHGCQLEAENHGFLKCTATFLAKSGQLIYEAGAGKGESLDQAKFAKVEGKFISQALTAGVLRVPHFQVTRDEMEVPALKEASINQAPRLAFTPEGDLVKDITYQRGG